MATSTTQDPTTTLAIVSSPSSAVPTTDPVPAHHASPVVAFIIGLAIIMLASIMNAAGLNLTKLDHVRMSAIPKASRPKDWMRPLWLLGMVLYILSQLIGSTLALEYMRAEYVAPLGSSSLVFNFLFARFLVGTPVTMNDIYGTIIVILGVIGIVAFGSINSGLSEGTDAAHLTALWRRGGWLGYFFAMTTALFLLIIFASCLDAVLSARGDLRAGSTQRQGVGSASTRIRGTGFLTKFIGFFVSLKAGWNMMISWVVDMLEMWSQPQDDKQIAWTLGILWACCGGGLAGGCLVFAKAVVKLLSGSLYHENQGNQFGHVASIFTIIFLAITAVLQIICLNRGLRVYDSTLVVPVFYGVYTATGFLNSLIFNNEVDSYQSWTLFLIFVSISVLISGVVLLTHKKPEPVTGKIRGAPTPRSGVIMSEGRQRTRTKRATDAENPDEDFDDEEDAIYGVGADSDEDDGEDPDIDHHLHPMNQDSSKPTLQHRASSNAMGDTRPRAGSASGVRGGSEGIGLMSADNDEDDRADDENGDALSHTKGKGAAAAEQNRRRSMDPFHDDNEEEDSNELTLFGLSGKDKRR